jgi:hypothetical protein
MVINTSKAIHLLEGNTMEYHYSDHELRAAYERGYAEGKASVERMVRNGSDRFSEMLDRLWRNVVDSPGDAGYKASQSGKYDGFNENCPEQYRRARRE